MQRLDKKEATKEEIEKKPTGCHLLEYDDIITEKHLAGLEEWKRNGLSLEEIVDLINAFGPIEPWNPDEEECSFYYFIPYGHQLEMKDMCTDPRLGLLVMKLQERGMFTKNPEDLDWIRLGMFLQEVIFHARTELERVGVVDKEGKINPNATVQPPKGIARVELRRLYHDGRNKKQKKQA